MLTAVQFVPENILLSSDSNLEIFAVRYLARGEVKEFGDSSQCCGFRRAISSEKTEYFALKDFSTSSLNGVMLTGIVYLWYVKRQILNGRDRLIFAKKPKSLGRVQFPQIRHPHCRSFWHIVVQVTSLAKYTFQPSGLVGWPDPVYLGLEPCGQQREEKYINLFLELGSLPLRSG